MHVGLIDFIKKVLCHDNVIDRIVEVTSQLAQSVYVFIFGLNSENKIEFRLE